MPVMWVFIVGLPVAFISASIAVTPDDPTPVELVEDGRRSLSIISMAEVHGAIMVPITIGFLASLAGLSVTMDSAQADRRLSLTQYRTNEILIVRMTVIAVASLVATAASIAVTAASFDAAPPAWGRFLPAHGAVRVMMDGAFTRGLDETTALILVLGWLLALAATAMAVFRRVVVR